MPTPVKYCSDEIRDAYKAVESHAQDELLSRLPEDLRPSYEEIFRGSKSEEDIYLRRLVKAADKLSALIKCIEEEKSGNEEFKTAMESTKRAVDRMREELPEVDVFCREFLPPYGHTLDELS